MNSLKIGMASIVAIGVGLLARDVVGAGFANLLLVIVFVVGCLYFAQHLMTKMLMDRENK